MAPDRRQAGFAIFLLVVAALVAASLLTGGPGTRAEGASAPGNPARGAKVFVGPDLDRLKPTFARIVRQVTRESAEMPAYRGVISRRAIRDVAAYVAWATRKAPPLR